MNEPSVIIAALYKFTSLPDKQEQAKKLKELLLNHKILGTLIIANEGINGTVAGSSEAISALKAYFNEDSRFLGMEYKESTALKNPFYRLKVKLKEEIVTLGAPEANPNEAVGTYVDAQRWNELLNDPDTVVIDVRNDYEVELGTFRNALNPKTESFREFPSFVKNNLDPTKHQKIAMSCTGGIRCEKASSYMKKQGFKEVFHLKGGVLQYLADMNKEQSMWQGECYVFDNRVSVDHDLKPGTFDLCHGCRFPISPEDKRSVDYIKGISCPRCKDLRTKEQKASATERQKQIDIAKARGMTHIGAH